MVNLGASRTRRRRAVLGAVPGLATAVTACSATPSPPGDAASSLASEPPSGSETPGTPETVASGTQMIGAMEFVGELPVCVNGFDLVPWIQENYPIDSARRDDDLPEEGGQVWCGLDGYGRRQGTPEYVTALVSVKFFPGEDLSRAESDPDAYSVNLGPTLGLQNDRGATQFV